nr:EOG090X0FII [Sida crystallina]
MHPYADGFVIVSKKKSGRRRNNHLPSQLEPAVTQISEPLNQTFDTDAFLRRIISFKEEIKLSEFFADFQTSLESALQISGKPEEIISLGLGSVSTCKTAQYQLGFLLLLAEECDCLAEVFDPVFTFYEREALTQLNLKISQENNEGNLCSGLRTLYFLPHCPRELSNNLLHSNWDSHHLAKCIIIANSFDRIRLNTPLRLLQDFQYLLRVEQVVEELTFKNSFRFPDIFNDLSLHIFPERKVTIPKADYWIKVEPHYQESTEFVKHNELQQ